MIYIIFHRLIIIKFKKKNFFHVETNIAHAKQNRYYK